MSSVTRSSLCETRCKPCEGGVPPIEGEALKPYLEAVPDWELAESGKAIRRDLKCGNFVKAVTRINEIADLAEAEQHHPDLHLTGYRHLRVELTTHAIGGLSENDFVVAAKIDRLLG